MNPVCDSYTRNEYRIGKMLARMIGGCTTFDDHSQERKDGWCYLARKIIAVIENPEAEIVFVEDD